MNYRRGFKSDAERIASEIRCELGLSATGQLDIRALAAHLEIPIIGMSQLAEGRTDFLQVFRYQEQDSFSALTLFRGTARIFVHIDSHHRHRQSSNIAHEISHCLLEHPPALPISPEGCRYWNAEVEAEADWLGAALLVPHDGGLLFVKRGWYAKAIAEHYNVSDRYAGGVYSRPAFSDRSSVPHAAREHDICMDGVPTRRGAVVPPRSPPRVSALLIAPAVCFASPLNGRAVASPDNDHSWHPSEASLSKLAYLLSLQITLQVRLES